MTDVLLGQAYYLRFDPKLWDAQQPYAPLGTLYAASTLRQHGHDVALFDAMLADSEAAWAVSLDRHRPRLAVLYEDSFNYLSKMCLLRMREAAVTMIEMARARGCVALVAGSDATTHPDVYLARGATAVIAGEGEATLQDVAEAFSGAASPRLDTIPGLWLLDGTGRAVMTTPRDRFRDLDALPRPAWDLVDVERYRQIWRSRHGYFSMNLATTRGCPYHCNWCARPIFGQRYAVRSPEALVDEIGWLHARYQPDHLNFVDDIFGLKPGWIERFAELMGSAARRVPFKCLLRADLVTDAIADALARAGCDSVWIGAESGSQRILDAMEKGTRVDQVEEATRRLKQAGISVGWFLQFGYPGETREDIDLTMGLLRRGRPDDIGISVSYPLPGTKFYESVREQLGGQQQWRDSSDLAMLYDGPQSTAFYRVLHEVVHKELRLRRAAYELAAALRRPSSMRPARHVRLAAAAGYYATTLPWARRRLNRIAGERRALAPPPAVPRHVAARPHEQQS